jgi:hypothetical protein
MQTPVSDEPHQRVCRYGATVDTNPLAPAPALHATTCGQDAPAQNDSSLYCYVEENFDDDLSDEEFLKLMCDTIETGSNIDNPTSSSAKDEPCFSSPNNTYTTSITSVTSTLQASKSFVSPMTLTSRLLAATGDIDCAMARKPIVRPSFPLAVRDRSPIIGLSSNMLLRTCFRIGEAINQAHQSSKSGKPIIIELYARIFDSTREDTKQYFTFCDLFHGKAPYVKAVYEGAIWRAVELFDYDSKRLLQQGRICRCMGTMKRDGKEWIMIVANIWEATWDDIKWVEGIVNA